MRLSDGDGNESRVAGSEADGGDSGAAEAEADGGEIGQAEAKADGGAELTDESSKLVVMVLGCC